ncbi:hypothetical protein B0A48_05707 [Cryoendolithus antarcticus]|uniref:Ubiquitin-like protease family profile domain-containing protein n=1 Tax=Cryoendolithus antarcticus TaxID=1507870 RepID=A0A1V8TBM2_9PEZI|nr:hypothetical protein B0A48_05707 [Cryoendolithus antarcticus]
MAVTTRSGKKASAENGAAPGTAAQASSKSVSKKSKKSKSPPEPAELVKSDAEALQFDSGTKNPSAEVITGEPAAGISAIKPQSSGKASGKRPLDGEFEDGSTPKKGKTTKEPAIRNHCKELDIFLQHLRATPLRGNAIVSTDGTTELSAVLCAITSVTEAINRLPAGPVFSLMNTGAVDSKMRGYGAIAQVVHPQLQAIFPLMFVSGIHAHLAVAVLRATDETTDRATAYLYDSRAKSRQAVEAHQSTPEHVFVHQAAREIMIGGWNADNTITTNLSVSVSTAPADQTNPKSCGVHAIFNGWAIAMGLEPSRGCIVNLKFYEDAVLLINAAVYGAATARDIEDFLRCKKFVLDTPVPERRVFENTVPMWNADTVNDLVARIATAQLEEDEIREALAASMQEEQPTASEGSFGEQPEAGRTRVSRGELSEEEQLDAAIAPSLEEQEVKSTVALLSNDTAESPAKSIKEELMQQSADGTGACAENSAQVSINSAAVDANGTGTPPIEGSALPNASADRVREESVETTPSLAELLGENTPPDASTSDATAAITSTSPDAATSDVTATNSAPLIETAGTASATSVDQPLNPPELKVLIRDFSPFPSPPSASTDPDLRAEPTLPQPPVPEINVINTEEVTTAQPIANPELVSPRDVGASAARWATFLTPPRSS